MKKIPLLLITTLLMPMFFISNVSAAEISDTITEVLIPTQEAIHSRVLFIPVSDCGSKNCTYEIYLNGTKVSFANITSSSEPYLDTEYYQLVFDFSKAYTFKKNNKNKNTIKIVIGSDSITTYSYTPEETTIEETCSSEVKLTTERGIILTRKVNDEDVEEYEELINIITPPGGYDVVAGTGVELPVWIFYTYQGNNKTGGSVLDYHNLLVDSKTLSLFTDYLPELLNEIIAKNEDNLYEVFYDKAAPELQNEDIYIKVDNEEEYTTLYYSDEDAVRLGLLNLGYEKIPYSERTEYQWERTNFKFSLTGDYSFKTNAACVALNSNELITGARLISSTTCYQKENNNPHRTCPIDCFNLVPPTFQRVNIKRFYETRYYWDDYTTACDSQDSDCDWFLTKVQNKFENRNKICSLDTVGYDESKYKRDFPRTTSNKKEVDCNECGKCNGFTCTDPEISYYCSYTIKEYYKEYYIGNGTWSKIYNPEYWTTDIPQNTYDEENITKIGERLAWRYYKPVDGELSYQTTELIKYELPSTYIEVGTNYLYDEEYESSKNVIDGGRRLYTDIKADDSILMVKVLGEDIGINQYKYDLTCDFNLLSNGIYDNAANIIIYRPVDPKDPFPEYDPLANWAGRETLITDKGYGVYSLTPEYELSLTSLDIKSIKTYNNLHGYLDYTLDVNEESPFIHKMFSGLFEVKKVAK